MATTELNSKWKKLQNIEPYCFACGLENEYGLQMEFESNGEKLRSRVAIPGHLRGWRSLVHGGIISTLIDEGMSWAAIHLKQKFILTKNMRSEFKKPVFIEKPVVVYSFVLEDINERTVRMGAEIYDEENDLCARGEGEFALFTLEQFAKMGIIDKETLEEMIASLGDR